MKKLLLILILFFTISTLPAQNPPPPDGIGFDDDINDEVPISGFVALGLAIGAVYGIRRVK